MFPVSCMGSSSERTYHTFVTRDRRIRTIDRSRSASDRSVVCATIGRSQSIGGRSCGHCSHRSCSAISRSCCTSDRQRCAFGLPIFNMSVGLQV